MNDLLNVGTKETITSLELVEQINYFRNEIEGKKELKHYDLLKIVRNEFQEEIGDGKISESYYINSQNKKQPMFNLTLSQAKQVLVRESRAVRKKAVQHLGGYKSPAYNNKSLRSRVFRDIHTQVKREYDLDSYKAIKRKNLEEAIGIIENHTLPKALMEEVYMYNRQITGF